MTAVHPLFIVDVADDTGENTIVTNRRPSTSVTNRDEQKQPQDDFDSEDDEDTRFSDETFASRDVLLDSISSMIRVLRVCGMYFRQEDAVKGQSRSRFAATGSLWSSTDEEHVSTRSDEATATKKRWYSSKIYSVLVLLLLWGNVVRFLTVFVNGDQFDASTINKMTTLAWNLLAAIMQTSCVVACWSGRLDRILMELRVTTEFANDIRRRSVICSCFGVMCFVFNVVFVSVEVFVGDTKLNKFYAPFNTYCTVSVSAMYAVKIAYVIVSVYIVAAWMVPQASNHVLAMIFFRQFKMLHDKFVAAIDENGRFNGDLRSFRRRHQALCRAVKRADHFVMIANFAGFVCHMFTVIFYLFSLVTFSTGIDVMTTVSFFTNLILNIAGLVLTTANGIAINEMVRC